MIRRGLLGVSLVLLGSTGCTWDELKPGTVKYDSGRNVPVFTPDKLPKASLEAASHVDAVGGPILAANKELGIRPAFITIGVPDLTIFHHGALQLFISEGLVRKCKTDAELAAILSSELGKMAAEAQMQQPVIDHERMAPLTPKIGSDAVGGGGDPDLTRLAEQAKFQEKYPKSRGGAVVSGQNPDELSRQYLSKAGYNPNELYKIAPLLRQAEANPTFEKQLTKPSGGLGIPNSP